MFRARRDRRRKIKTEVVMFVEEGLTRKERRDTEKRIAELKGRIDESAPVDVRARLPLSPTGKHGPGMRTGEYWNQLELAQPANQGSSRNLAGIYPFLADEGIGHRGPLMGIDLTSDVLWHFSPWDSYQAEEGRETFSTNILVIGAYRAGKSATIKQLVFRSLAFGFQSIVPSDSKGEWGVVAEAAVVNGKSGQVVKLGGGSHDRINPLARGPRATGTSDKDDEIMVTLRRRSTLVTVVEATLVGQPALSPQEHSTLQWALEKAIADTDDEPTIRAVYDNLEWLTDTPQEGRLRKLQRDAERTLPVLRRFVSGDLQGLFEEESTVVLDPDAPMVVIDTSALFDRSEEAGTIAQICASSWIQAVISDRQAKKRRYLIREEGWRDMASLSALRTYQQWLKLSRHYGVANILILHKMSDFDAVGPEGSVERGLADSIANDIENKFVFRQNVQEYENLVKRLHIPPSQVRSIMKLSKGTFKAYVGMSTYEVDAFATSTAWEYELFKTDDAVEGSERVVTEFDHTPDDYMLDLLLPVPVTSDDTLSTQSVS
jgi:hypothetical protein